MHSSRSAAAMREVKFEPAVSMAQATSSHHTARRAGARGVVVNPSPAGGRAEEQCGSISNHTTAASLPQISNRSDWVSVAGLEHGDENQVRKVALVDAAECAACTLKERAWVLLQRLS